MVERKTEIKFGQSYVWRWSRGDAAGGAAAAPASARSAGWRAWPAGVAGGVAGQRRRRLQGGGVALGGGTGRGP